MPKTEDATTTRRRFLGALAVLPFARLRAAGTGVLATPPLTRAIAVGDVAADRALIWCRAERPSQMWVEWSLDRRFDNATLVRGPHALETSDLTARLDLAGLPADREVFVRVHLRDLVGADDGAPLVGRFRTAPASRRNLRFLFSGDTAGQGWGINPDIGGMTIFETMRRTNPDFFIHCGDTIYADGPIPPEQTAEDGRVWRNVVTPEVAKVAETLDEFRGRYRYNLLDENVRRFSAEVPQVWLWDDHEVMNNWSASKDLTADSRYVEKHVPLLIARASRAFLEYAPLRPHDARESERVYRRLPYGELLDVFALDLRSYRGPNSYNRQPTAGPDTALLGADQLTWLKRELKASRAVWKAIATDMPLGLLVRDGKDAQGRDRFENGANGNGPPLGRELEYADLLSYIKAERIQNVVWFTADVHYCAAHHYEPSRARFQDFAPFWEFVGGPLNAGTFGPAELDDTFGPRVDFQAVPPNPNTSPFAGMQFFGQVDIDANTRAMTVTLKDARGTSLYTRALEPA